MKTTFKLTKPITVHGKEGAEKIDTLTLKEPSGDLVLEHGFPHSTLIESNQKTGTQRIEIKLIPQVFREYLKFMAGLDGGAIGQISFGDMQRLSNILLEIANDAGDVGNSEPSATS